MIEAPLLAIVALVLFVGAALSVGRNRREASQPTQPDLDTGHVIVTGWRSQELETILSDFAKLYSIEPGTFRLHSRSDNALTITWAAPILTDHLQFLVNYIHYPNGFDLKRANPQAVGIAPICEETGPQLTKTGPKTGLSRGTIAKYYVPRDDEEYDVIYAQLETGDAFRVPLTNHRWEPVNDPRDTDFVRSAPFDLKDA